MSRLRKLLDALPGSKGVLPDEGQIDCARGKVGAAFVILSDGDREPEVRELLRGALEELAGREIA